MNSGYERIYHFHVRKTAGSSLNAAFWALGGPEAEAKYAQPTASEDLVESNGLKFVRRDSELISHGDYLFASSHTPAYLLQMPPGTFTVTILRDPCARALSYYSYLHWARTDPSALSAEPFIDDILAEGTFLDGGYRYAFSQLSPSQLRTESAIPALGVAQFAKRLGRLLAPGHGFEAFLNRVPPRRLMTQLYMFSKRMDPAEAAENILACSAVCFTETFSVDLRRLADTLELDLQEKQERRFGKKPKLPEPAMAALRERLGPEYRMLELVHAGLTPGREAIGV